MAKIHKSAKIGKNNKFGNGVIIGSDVEIGDGNVIESYVCISGKTVIGNENFIGTGTVIGGVSNHIRRKPEIVSEQNELKNQVVEIGNQNLLGEYVTIHTPVINKTLIGSNVNIGVKVHIAHDVTIENSSILNSNCCIGGYVKILEGANLGLGINIHPRIIIGQYAMIGLGTVVIRHILPSATVAGNPQRYIKPNILGMKRNKLPLICINELTSLVSGQQLLLANLSETSRMILNHFIESIQKNQFARNVPCIPSCDTLLSLWSK